MTRSRHILGYAALAWLAAIGAGWAQERTVLVDDLSLPALWRTDVWSKAPGRIEPLRETPPEAAECLGAIAARIAWPMDDEFRFFGLQSVSGRGPIPFGLKSVSLWVRGEGDGHYLELHFADAKGEDRKAGLPPIEHTGWFHHTVSIPEEWPQPLEFKSLTWHNWGMKNAGGEAVTGLAQLEGVVDTSAPLAEVTGPRLAAVPAAEHGVADAEGRCRVEVRVFDWAQTPTEAALRSRVSDAAGNVVGTGEAAVAGEGVAASGVDVALPRFGAYAGSIDLVVGGEVKASASIGLAHVPPPEALSDDQRLASPIGVNTHFNAPWELFGRLGIHWARDYCWGWLGRGETAPLGNGLDFSGVLDRATAAGVNVLPITQGSFRNKDQSGFLDDVTAIQGGFAKLSAAFPAVDYWEIDNELDYAVPAKRLDLDNYTTALRAAHEGLLQSGDATLVLNGTAGIHYEDTLELLRSDAADAFGVVNYHYYTGTTPPETAVADVNVGGDQRRIAMAFVDQLRRINDAAHGTGKGAWLTEIGWDAERGPAVGEALQATYLPRAYLLALWAGTDKVFWYFDRDTDGDGIFSTCGLLRMDGSLRPSAVALATLSREVATAELLGAIDVGEDAWAMALRRPDGTFVVPAWSVHGERPVPQALAEAEGVDLFGNAVRPAAVTPEVTYFHLRSLPELWQRQLEARWLSPSILTAVPGGEVTASAAPGQGRLAWRELPEGVDAGPWTVEGDRATSRLRVAPSTAVGRYPARAVAEGDGWRREWTAAISVEPALDVAAGPYQAGQPLVMSVRTYGDGVHVTARLDGDGVIAPTEFDLEPGGVQGIAVVPSARAEGVLRVEFATDTGVTQWADVRPSRLGLRRVGGVRTDGVLDDWPPETAVVSGALVLNGDAPGLDVRLGWEPGALLLCASMPVPGMSAANPQSFWDFTNIELFVDGSPRARAWGAATRQFFFVPERGGDGWKLTSGLWERPAGRAIMGTPCETAARVEGDVLHAEARIPTAALGFDLAPGMPLRLGLALQGVCRDRTWQAAWPRLKTAGLLDGPASWGEVRLAE